MTDVEIVKALECCAKCNNAFVCTESKCPLFKQNCIDILTKNALDLINRQKAEIAELQHKNSELEIELKAMRGAANSYKAEVERLERPIRQHCIVKMRSVGKEKMVRLHIRNITAEAITEFAKRLCEGRVSNDPVVIAVQSELRECELYNVEGDNNAD